MHVQQSHAAMPRDPIQFLEPDVGMAFGKKQKERRVLGKGVGELDVAGAGIVESCVLRVVSWAWSVERGASTLRSAATEDGWSVSRIRGRGRQGSHLTPALSPTRRGGQIKRK